MTRTWDAVAGKQLNSKQSVSEHDKKMNVGTQRCTVNIARVNRVEPINEIRSRLVKIHVQLINLNTRSDTHGVYVQ